MKDPAGQKGERLLWMTDTFEDRNGVSTVLRAIHREIKARELPVDLMVCSSSLEPDDHLIVVKPVMEFSFPFYRQQPMRIPDYLEVRRKFLHGGYNRILCSTEGPMGMAALGLKNLYGTETSLFIHTDWLMFAREALGLGDSAVKRLERALRIYYHRFNSLFVLNTDHRAWLTGETMRVDPSRVFLTAHWADEIFRTEKVREEAFPFPGQFPVLLYAGRVSREKGVMELPAIAGMIRTFLPEVQIVVAGTGPALDDLRAAMPQAHYLGWVDRETLPALYRAADILLLPSRFDTFSCVVLEALSCGLPVAAYNSKGPRDILTDGVNGYLSETAEEMAGSVIRYLLDAQLQRSMQRAALLRADAYRAEGIMDRLLEDAGIRPLPAIV